MVANEMRSCQKGSEGSRCLLANQPTSLHLSTSPSKQRWQWQWWFCRFRVEIELCAPYMLGDTHHSSTHCLKSEKFLDQFLFLSHHRSRTGSVESTVRILVVGRRDTLWIGIRERFVFNTIILVLGSQSFTKLPAMRVAVARNYLFCIDLCAPLTSCCHQKCKRPARYHY